jgi:hypothetical protein
MFLFKELDEGADMYRVREVSDGVSVRPIG